MTDDHSTAPRSPSSSKSPRKTSRSNSSGHNAPDFHNLGSAETTSTSITTSPRSQHSSSSSSTDNRPGSSRTRFRTLTSPTIPAVPLLRPPLSRIEDDTSRSEDASSDLTPLGSSSEINEIDMDAPHAPYRPPEAVIEPPEDHPPGYVPGVISEHPESDDEMPRFNVSPQQQNTAIRAPVITGWQPYDDMDVDRPDSPDRPQILPGMLPRRFLEVVHEHELHQPFITELPQRSEKKVAHTPSSSLTDHPSATSSNASTSQTSVNTINPAFSPTMPTSAGVPSATLDDVWNACPGGLEGHRDWYFCTRCGGWIRVVVSHEEPRILNMEEWASIVMANKSTTARETDFETARENRYRQWARYNDLKASKHVAPSPLDHIHEFDSLLMPTPEERIERIDVDDDTNAFPHLTLGITPETWAPPQKPPRSSRLFASCSSDLWIVVEDGIVPGQIPMSLLNDFCSEKSSNPLPGLTGNESINNAWDLILTLLANPIFKSQRGWVKLDNKKFQEKIGATLASSCLLYYIGFGCRQEQDALRVGPFSPGEKVDAEAVEQMNQYMLRAWVEVGIFLTSFQNRNHLTPALPRHTDIKPLSDVLETPLRLDLYPKLTTVHVSDRLAQECITLGVSKFDTANSIQTAYDAQRACDVERTKQYLSALESISMTNIPNAELLQIKAVSERSMGRFAVGDVERSYNQIGYTTEHADLLQISPSEAPDEYILELHKKAVQAASSSAERADLAQALVIIGKDRQSESMIRLGNSGQTFMSVDDAYAALSAPRDSIDDGLIMQYEMAVAEYPGKTEHYKTCLNIIANAPGEDRPGIRTFLDTGSRQPDAPARKDIPVGLHNIGNTCYLNSILQYLYSVKPLREAVISFEQNSTEPRTPFKPEIERSRRFVRQLRLLFLQLYKSDQSAVRPDEELAYLAITRPEVDQIVEPEIGVPPAPPLLDSIPNIPSPSSTRVATPDFSPTIDAVSLPDSPRLENDRGGSILGKRASTDRDDSSRSSMDHSRHKSEGFEDLGHFPPIDLDAVKASEDFEAVLGDKTSDMDTVESPSAVTDLAGLKLKSPELEEDNMVTVPPPLPPRPNIARKDTLASGLRFGLQQDSAEVLINVLTQLETAFDPATAEEGVQSRNFISELFSCNFRQQTFYEDASGNVEAQTPANSVFVHPIIGVEEEGKDLYDCLAELYLKGADIEYEGKKGYMMDLMDKFPPMLYIQMRRSQYDFKTGRETKTNTHIAFDQVLAMDRFLVNADQKKREESIEITREMSRIRTRLHQLKNHQPMSIPLTFKHAREALGEITDVPDLDIPIDFLDALESAGDEVSIEIAGLEESLPNLKKRLEDIWEESREFEYELVSVFMHRGKTSGAGHYWTYQSHLPDHPERFYKYNDETVTEVPNTEVLHDRTGSDANPALLCYVRKGKDLVDTLHREILELEQQQPEAKEEEKEKVEMDL